MAATGRHGPKTHSACVTCKKRRVKCDLEGPPCGRCIRVKRTCDGYQLSVVEARPNLLAQRDRTPPHARSSTLLLSAFRATEAEWQAYGYYNLKVASILGGVFDTELWQSFIIQVAEVEPTVRQGIFALGSLFRHQEVSNNISECACLHCRSALRHFNKSISAFSAYIERPAAEQTPEVALLSCVIFVCLESYRMNNATTVALISKGCNIAATAMSHRTASHTRTNVSNLLNLFDRLWLLSNMFGFHVPRPLPRPLHDSLQFMSSTFDTIEHARDCLHQILTKVQSLRLRIFQAHLESMLALEKSEAILSFQIEQETLLSLLSEWHSKIKDFADRPGSQFSRGSQAWCLLVARYLITKIRAGDSIDPTNPDDLSQLENYERLVAISEEGLKGHTTEEEAEPFSLEVCYLPALYITACKCRHSTLRRRALALMNLTAARESLWHRGELIRIAARVIELEEGLATIDVGHPSMDVIQQPPRIADVFSSLNYRKDGTSYVDVSYLIYDAHCLNPLQVIRETLDIPDKI